MTSDSAAPPPFAELGRRLTDARRASGLTRAEVTAAIGMAAGVLQRYERGDRQPPSSSAKQLADLYGIKIEALLAPAGGGRADDGALAAPQIFGANVRRVRETLHLSTGALARKIGLREGKSVAELESGRSTRAMRESLLPKLEAALGVDRDDLLAMAKPRHAPVPPVADAFYAAEQVMELAYELRRLAERAQEIQLDLLTRNRVP